MSAEAWEAIEVDVLRQGYHLSDLNYRELLSLVRHSPRESEYFRLMFGEQSHWGAVEHLLATIADILNLILWLTGNPKKTKRPEPLPRPGLEPEKPRLSFGNKESAVPESEFWAVWNDGMDTTEPVESDEGPPRVL